MSDTCKKNKKNCNNYVGFHSNPMSLGFFMEVSMISDVTMSEMKSCSL